MDCAALTYELKRRAAELGFSRCGLCPAVSPPGAARLDEWLAAGYAGQMRYLADRREAVNHPNSAVEGGKKVGMLARGYWAAGAARTEKGRGGEEGRIPWAPAS